MHLTHEEIHTIYIIRSVLGSISLLGSASIITIFLLYKHLRSFLMRLVIYLIISDALRSISLLLPVDNRYTRYIQTVLIEFTIVSAVLWSLLISIALYLGTVARRKNVERLEYVFLSIGYALPAVLTGIQFIIGVEIECEGWCWIKIDRGEYTSPIVRISCFYLPLLLSIIVCSYLYYKIIITIQRNLEGIAEETTNKRKIIRRLLMYPFVIFVCIFPVFILSADLFPHTKINFYRLSLAIIIIGSSSGFLNAIIYGLTDSVKDVICKKRRNKNCHSSLVEDSILSDIM